jgi:hypothetical protein
MDCVIACVSISKWVPPSLRRNSVKNGSASEGPQLARKHSVEAMQKLIEKMDSSDERVALIAQQAVLERAWGKPKEYDPSEERPPVRVDLSKLSLAKKKEMLDLVRQTVTVAEETPVPPVPAQVRSR